MILFLGAPGSGKGTQSRLLKKKHNLDVFAVGDLLRLEISKGSLLGKKVKDRIDSGLLVDTDIIMELFDANVRSDNCILDGFPRNIEQAIAFSRYLEDRKVVLHVFDFVLPVDIVKKRLLARKICKTCLAPLTSECSVCQFCGSKDFVQRMDDSENVIEKRINEFVKNKDDLSSFYKNNKNYHLIDVDKTVDEINSEIEGLVYLVKI